MGIIITIMSGAEDGKRYEINKPQIILGRDTADDIYLSYDNRVSMHHARIIKADLYFIEDLGPDGHGSRSGTYVEGNDKKISGKIPISPNQLILLGYVWIKFDAR
jgi:pSer/pThr/pTyr-binding forkhead associated (FHA) protein